MRSIRQPLLVAIVAICVLLAPLLLGCWRVSQQTRCQQNTKQIALGMRMKINDRFQRSLWSRHGGAGVVDGTGEIRVETQRGSSDMCQA